MHRRLAMTSYSVHDVIKELHLEQVNSACVCKKKVSCGAGVWCVGRARLGPIRLRPFDLGQFELGQ